MPDAASDDDAPIFLVGFMASGKTTVGQMLAARLGWAFVDLDELVTRTAGMAVPAIFAAEGEPGFRRRESAAVGEAAARRRAVVATGGGAACREDNLAAMLAAGRVVALAVSPAEAVRRAGGASGRPLLDGHADPVAAARGLLAARDPFYSRAHLRIDTDGRNPEQIADAVLEGLRLVPRGARGVSTTIRVELGPRSYDVRIGTFAAGEIADAIVAALDPATTGVAVMVDEDVGRRSPRVAPLVEALAARLPRVERLDLPAGEACKTLAEIARTTEWLAGHAFDRRSAVVGIGGGAATDHAGFAAAIYLRGVASAMVPTTLLAMVDASVGGKTGVDLGAGKNLVGAFHQPRAVVADVGFLETLPRRELTAGLAEVVKCGFIADPGLLDLLERAPAGAAPSPALTLELIARAVRVKADVVASDEHEGGRRAILNFGHTVGHAVEAASNYGLLHGEAVALGMVAALRLGAALGLGPPALVDRATALLTRLGLPTDFERRLDADAVSRISVDKKRRGRTIRFVFVPAPGETRLVEVTPADIATHLVGPKA